MGRLSARGGGPSPLLNLVRHAYFVDVGDHIRKGGGKGSEGKGMDLLCKVVDRGKIVHTPFTALPGRPIETDSGSCHLLSQGGVWERKAEVAQVYNAHDPRTIRRDVLITSGWEADDSREVQGL